MSDTARLAAPEIDRLVLSVNADAEARYGDSLLEVARANGLGSLALVSNYGDFLVGGGLDREVAVRRMPYWPETRILDHLDGWTDAGLVSWSADAVLTATAPMAAVVAAYHRAQADVAGAAWGGHDADVAAAASLAARLISAAPDDHLVAVAHRRLPLPEDVYLALHRRLVTLRFVRQHDHVAAWSAVGLSASEIIALTAMWMDPDGAAGGEGLSGLEERGLVAGSPPALTDAGRTVRDDIEAETNRRAQHTYDALDAAEGAAFIAALRRLPGVRP